MIVHKPTALFALCIGVLMFAMWSFFMAAGLVPEFETRPAEIILHLSAEFLTAIMLMAAGILSLRKKRVGAALMPFALGMLMYTVIVSPGYYIQQGDMVFAVMFGVIAVADAIFLIRHLRALVVHI